MGYLLELVDADTPVELAWLLICLLGQLLFTARFLVQWLASERAVRSVVPVAFWYFSILGSVIVLTYGIHKVEPVIIVGQLPGTLIYARNLWLIRSEKRG